MLSNSGYVSRSIKETLTSLTEEEKKTVVIDVVKYTKIGEEEVSKVKSRVGARTILTLVLILYIIIEAYVISQDCIPGYTKNLSQKNGELSQDYNESELGVFFGPVKLREIYLKAERERVLKLKEEIEKNLEEGSEKKLLTRYERKIK